MQLQKQALRTEMLTGLATVVSTNTDGGFSSDSLSSLSDMLSSLTSNVYEVSPKMVNTISQVAYSVLSSATKSNVTVSYDSLSGLLSSVNTVIQLSNTNARSAEVLNLFCDLITSQLVSGENDVNYIYDEFRMKVVSTSLTQGTSLQIVAPQTVMESTFNSQSASSISIQQQQLGDQKALAGGSNSMVDMSISMLITTASSYGSLAMKMNNNPVQVKLSSRGDQPTEIVFTLSHNADKTFTNASQAAEMGFNTTCHGPQDHSTYNYTCHESHEVLAHSCNGRRGVLTSYCKILAPKCALIDSNSGDIDANSSVCYVVDYSKSNTVCRCLIQPLRSQRRLDNNVAMDGVLNVVSTSLFVANNFKNTFSSAGDMNSVADLQRLLIVIVMFSVMWASGLLLIFSCIWRRKYMMKVNVLEKQLLERKRRVAQISYSVAMVQQNLLNYTSQVFPSIFSNEPIARRIWSEICRHHRYLTLMTASKGEAGDNQRILTCIQLLTVQTMLMFLLALLYDFQGPSDDGTCNLNQTETDCLYRKSVLDRSQSYCAWNGEGDGVSTEEQYPCIYKDPTFTIETVLIIAILVSVMVALFSKPIDMIFDLLTAPIADDLKSLLQIMRLTLRCVGCLVRSEEYQS